MTTYTPATEMGKGMLHLRHMLALSATLQAAVGSYSAAFDRVWYKGIPGADMVEAYSMDPIDTALPMASIWPHSAGFRLLGVDCLREVGQFHVYMNWPTDLRTYAGWNDRLLHAFDKLQNWAVDVCNLSAQEDGSPNGPIVSGESHLAISMAEAPFNEHTPMELRPPGAQEQLEFANDNRDFQWRHMVVSVGDGEGGA